MSIDSDKIKNAIDAFENDEFTDAEILRTEIQREKNDHLKDKLGLEKDLNPVADD